MLPLINIPRIDDDRGSLCVIEAVPFPIKRIYYLLDVQPGAARGGHAHRNLQRWLVAVAGGFRATLDGADSVRLYRPDRALYVAPMRWLELSDFSPGAVCLVLASAPYDPQDYIRERAEWECLTPTAL